MNNEERIEQAEQTVAAFNKALVKRGEIFLEVEVNTVEAADEIMRWLYSEKDSPMKATLLQVAWDKALVSKKIGEAVQIIQNDNQ